MNSSGTGWISGEQSKRDQARGKWAFSHLFDLSLSSWPGLSKELQKYLPEM